MPSSGVGPASSRSPEAGQLRPGQAWRAAGVGPLAQGLGAAAVVAGDPVLDRAHAAAEGRGDRGGGAALGGEDDGLVADPDPLLGDRLGQALQLLEGEMVVDMHGGAPGVGRSPLILPDPRSQRNTYAENSWEVYESGPGVGSRRARRSRFSSASSGMLNDGDGPDERGCPDAGSVMARSGRMPFS